MRTRTIAAAAAVVALGAWMRWGTAPVLAGFEAGRRTERRQARRTACTSK